MAGMQFWGVEIKAKESCPVTVDGAMIHLSQATLGDLKKDETVTINVTIGEKKHVLGILSQNTPQLAFDLVFNEDFELSHNRKNGSVHLLGYQAGQDCESSDEEYDSSDEEELPVAKENGKPAPSLAKPIAVAKPKLDNKQMPESDIKSAYDDHESSESSDDEDDFDDDASDEEMGEGDSDEDEDDSEEESEEETPAKSDVGKKRPNGNAKTPEPKKVKMATPQKTDSKKGAPHSATPHPAKKGGKTPGADKSPGSQVSCGSCKKTFNSDKALDSHTKAKHAAK